MNKQEEIKNVIKDLNQVIEDAKKKITECENKLNTIQNKPKDLFEKYGIKEFPVQEGSRAFYVAGDSTVDYSYTTKTRAIAYSSYSDKEHAERIAKFQYLSKKALWIAEQLRDGYKWGYSDDKYIIIYRYDLKAFSIVWVRYHNSSPFYFQSKEKAQQFIEIMGEDDLKFLLIGGEV